jgi:hypothetical protein
LDQRVVKVLQEAGIDTTFEKMVSAVRIEVDDQGAPKVVGKEVLVVQGEKASVVELQPISALLIGTKQPPSFKEGPAPGYEFFFMMFESTVINFFASTEQPVYDEELARLYNLLRRRPDGSDSNPLFGYLQAAARLYLSLRDVSPAEFEAVLNRLTRSAKHFAQGPASTNLIQLLIKEMMGALPGGEEEVEEAAE